MPNIRSIYDFSRISRKAFLPLALTRRPAKGMAGLAKRTRSQPQKGPRASQSQAWPPTSPRTPPCARWIGVRSPGRTVRTHMKPRSAEKLPRSARRAGPSRVQTQPAAWRARARIDNAQGIGATDSRPPTHGYPADLPTEKRSNKDPCNRPLTNSYSIGRHAYNKPKARPPSGK